MNAELLLAQYQRVADAPDAIARLRRFILDLAVRGKLVPQDKRDEPASRLLVRMRVEKRTGDEMPRHPPISDVQPPFELPSSWIWSNVGEICSKTGSGSTPRGGKNAYRESGIIFLRSQNIYNDGLKLKDVAFIDSATHARMARTTVRPKDLLLNITGGSIGRCCRIPDGFAEANVSQHVAIIRVAIDGVQDFVHRFILSSYFQACVWGEQTGAGRGGLPKGRMDRIPVALPPIAEQRRIVAKVDELMALCDQWEIARKEREARRDRLTAASLARLNASDIEQELFASHTRFTLDNFSVFSADQHQIKHLRRTVLDMATRGKLVDQNPNDEPASDLLKRITEEKAALTGQKSSRKPRNNKVESIALSSLSLPSGWSCSSIGSIALKVTDGTHKTPTYIAKGIPFVSVKDFSAGRLDLSNTRFISEQEHRTLSKRCDPKRGDILLGRIGTLGRAVLVDTDQEFSLFVSVGLIRFSHQHLVPEFLRMLLNSPIVEMEFDRIKIGGATHTNKLNLGDLHSVILPIPPIAEQHRIVAKVDELMALCDRLETSLIAGEDHRRRLLSALLAEALAPAEMAIA